LGVPGSRFCTGTSEVETLMHAHDTVFPVVIKPAFGGSGFGLRVISAPLQVERELPFITTLCAHGGVVVEPWLARQCDMSTTTVIGRDGGCGPVTFLRQLVNSYGTFFGIYCDDNDAVIAPWKKKLESSTLKMAAEVMEKGYFGPVVCDSFVYRTPDGQDRLVTVNEVNARFTMGMITRNLRELIAPDLPVLLRFLGRKRCQLPDSYTDWVNRCGEYSFNPGTKKGILLLTPLRNGFWGKWVQPERSVFLIAGSSEEEIAAYDRELCLRISK
jgi:hypothetical protein